MRMSINALQRAINRAKKEGCKDVRFLHNTVYFYFENDVKELTDYVDRHKAEIKVLQDRIKALETEKAELSNGDDDNDIFLHRKQQQINSYKQRIQELKEV